MNQVTPLVSICIPVYNGERFIAECVRSALDQRWPCLEVIVQDNCSTDRTWPILVELARTEPRLSIDRGKHHVPMGSNWSAAIRRATGHYVALLSADDLLHPDFVPTAIQSMEQSGAEIATTNHWIIVAPDWIPTARKASPHGDEELTVYRNFAELILRNNPFSINFTLLSKSIVDRLAPGSRDLFLPVLAADYDLWLRIAMSGHSVVYLPRELGYYRVHGANLSAQSMRLGIHTVIVLFRRMPQLGFSHFISALRVIYRCFRGIAGSFLRSVLTTDQRRRPPSE